MHTAWVESRVVFGFAPIASLESDQGAKESRSQSDFPRRRLWLSQYTTRTTTTIPVCFLLYGIFGSDESLEASSQSTQAIDVVEAYFCEAELRGIIKSP